MSTVKLTRTARDHPSISDSCAVSAARVTSFHTAEVEKVADRVAKLIVAYATNYETMTDTKADAFFKEHLATIATD